MIFSLSKHGREHWLTRLHCGGDKSLLIISYANFLTVYWQFSDDSKTSYFLSQGNDNCPNLLFVRRWLCRSNCDCCNWVLHVVLPLTSYDLYSQILSVYESPIKVSSILFFWLFLLQNARKSSDIYEKYPFLVFFGATDGNFTEKYSVTPSWQRTCLWQMTGVRIVSCTLAEFNMF